MTAAPSGQAVAAWQRPAALPLLRLAIALVLLLQVGLVFTKSINWDEFFHFSQIHQHLLGRPAPWLQAPFVALFFWVPSLPGGTIDHILVIRLLILPFELATIAAIAGMARRLAGRETALLCALVYVAGGYVFLHGFALRADMIAASLLMISLWIGLCCPLRPAEMTVAALLVGLAFLSTIKSVLFAPAFLGVALFRLDHPAQRRVLAGVAVSLLCSGSLLLALAPHLPTSGPVGFLRDIGELGRASIHRMFSGELLPQSGWLIRQMAFAPLFSAAIVAALLYGCWPGRDRRERLFILLMLAPLATVAIYRNAFPYHYAFILAPAAVAIAPIIHRLRLCVGAGAVAVLPLAGALCLFLAEDRTVLPRQRLIDAGIHRIFSAPVVYIDNSGMAGDYPRAEAHFASGWGLHNYRRSGVPRYSQALRAEPVPMLLANNAILRSPFGSKPYRGPLHPRDAAVLRANYIPHWGRVFVAGRVIASGRTPVTIQVAVPGRYTIEGGGISVDGTNYRAGDVIMLGRGVHRIAGPRAVEVTLRWGENLPRPDFAWPSGPIYTEY